MGRKIGRLKNQKKLRILSKVNQMIGWIMKRWMIRRIQNQMIGMMNLHRLLIQKIPNPDYKGPWVHPEIDNPEYVEAKDVYKRGPVGYVGIEVWQVKAGTVFSDFILSDSLDEAVAFLEERKTNEDEEKKAKEAYDEANKPEEESGDEDDESTDDTEEDHDEL